MVVGAGNGKQATIEPKTFGEVLKDLRTRTACRTCKHCRAGDMESCQGLSQAKLAERAGLSAGYIGLIETGDRGKRPTKDVVLSIANAMECNIPELEELMRAAGHLGNHQHLVDTDRPTVPAVIAESPLLTDEDKEFLIAMYERLARVAP